MARSALEFRSADHSQSSRRYFLVLLLGAAALALLGAAPAGAGLNPPMNDCSQSEVDRCRAHEDGCTPVQMGIDPPECFCFCPLPYSVPDTLSIPDRPTPIGPFPSAPGTRPDYAPPKPPPISEAADAGCSEPPPRVGFYPTANNYGTPAVWDAGHNWVWHVSPDGRERTPDGHAAYLAELNGERRGPLTETAALTDGADLQLPTLYQLEELAEACLGDACSGEGSDCTSPLSEVCAEMMDSRGASPACVQTRTTEPPAKPGALELSYAVCVSDAPGPGGEVSVGLYSPDTRHKGLYVQPNSAARAWFGGGPVDDHYGCQSPARMMTCQSCPVFPPGVANPTAADCFVQPWGIDFFYTQQCRERPCMNGSGVDCGPAYLACW